MPSGFVTAVKMGAESAILLLRGIDECLPTFCTVLSDLDKVQNRRCPHKFIV